MSRILVEHLVSAISYYDDLAVKTIRQSGWKIISIQNAYDDKLYNERPINTYSNDGIIAQIAFEKTAIKSGFKDDLDSKLKAALHLN